MLLIDLNYYIKMAKNMENNSAGGSPSYIFDDLVLVKYVNKNEYGYARENEEDIFEVINKKNAQGVRTPKHLAIKRVVEGDENICYVLQEKAKGRIFSDYCYGNDVNTQIKMQSILANAKITDYEKFISDVCLLFNCGIELKPKNIFYDEDIEKGGFTIIDFTGIDGKPFNYNCLEDVLYLIKQTEGIYNCSRYLPWNYNDENVYKSTQLYYKIRQKMFNAMEKIIPNFSIHRRWVLRTFPKDVLAYFENNGTEVGNLNLSEEEYQQFNAKCEHIINKCVEQVISGEVKISQINTNEIRNSVIRNGLDSSFLYHRDNHYTIEDFAKDDYKYVAASSKSLQETLKVEVNKRINDIIKINEMLQNKKSNIKEYFNKNK